MKRFVIFLIITFVMTLAVDYALARDKIRVVTTLPDLAALAKVVGGDKVEVEALVKGTQDPHNIEVLPSYMVKLRNADLFVIIGMDLEMWAYPLRDGSRNAKLVMVDCSLNIERLEVPTYKVDPSYGDIHIYGNPHYWLDPENGKVIMASILDGLAKVSPQDYDYFVQNMQAYSSRLDEKIKEWQEKMAPYRGSMVIFYHNSWPYFARRFGLNVVNFVEPKPGVEPSPSHTAALIRQVKEKGIKVIGKEPFFDERVPKLISRETGAKVIVLPPSVGGVEGVNDYIGLFDYNINALSEALKG
ncbi:MAG: metal ABC transporter substrate-binding protein [candidate division KSB1 bacterium]|nr:metal ABC transporter substrate-binding protein [candidate division KSB1 bacterium]MDZ7304225.1 metal ABC transporter substrate-binding protein [candidate division KSB1 bacterium]MDZ7311700.1 metal ABC transporter substrate-binding protein [candidate division KSB1 bacterium]